MIINRIYSYGNQNFLSL